MPIVPRVEYVNAFLKACLSCFKDWGIDGLNLGKPGIQKIKLSNNLLIAMVGVTGNLKGQIFYKFETQFACEVASKMSGMEIGSDSSDLLRSAIAEISNIISGQTLLQLSRKSGNMDISPPSVIVAKGEIATRYPAISLPFLREKETKSSFEVDYCLE